MPPVTRYCPKCGSVLNVPHPAPEKMPCPKCGAVLRFSPAKSGSQAAPPLQAPARGAAVAVVNKTVAGHQLQRELARGGLGVIYLAYHPHFADFRAIKRPLQSDGVERDVLLARFRREVQAVGGLRSNNVIRAYDAGEDAEGPYVVTEYLDGESFSSLATRLCMLPVPEACELIRQAALGLQAAHARGLVHRDVKPSNLMLARDGTTGARVVVIDWGLVKAAGDGPTVRLTQLHTEMGTLDYISPEQIRDAHTVDIRADIYSLGATLYCLLAGQPPFAGRSDDEKRQAHEREKFPRLDRVRPSVPRQVLDILEKMVKKNPAERYQTPGEVANALQPFGCAGPHLLLALLAPAPSRAPPQHPAAETPPLRMKDILTAETILTPPAVAPISQRSYPNQPAPAPAQRISTAPTVSTKRPWSGLRIGGLLLVGFSFLACAGVASLVVYEEAWKVKDTTASTKGKPKYPPAPTGPRLPGGEPGLMKAMSGHPHPASEIAFMPDGRTGISRHFFSIAMWDLSDYVQRPAPWGVSRSDFGLITVSPDGKRIAAATTNLIDLWNGKTYNKDGPLISIVGNCTALAFSPDSKILATAERIIIDGKTKFVLRFWDAEEREQKKTIDLEAPALGLSFSPDGQFLAVSNSVKSGDKKMFVYRADNLSVVRQLDGHPESACVAAFFADGKRLLSASPRDGTLRFWNVDEADKENVGKEIGKPIQAGTSVTDLTNPLDAKDPNVMSTVAFWPWGRALTAHLDGGLKLWDLDTGEQLLRFKNPSEAAHSFATALAISPDGYHALAAYNDAKVYLFRLPPPRDK